MNDLRSPSPPPHLASLAAVVLGLVAATGHPAIADDRPTAIEHVRVFDGHTVQEDATVVVRGDRVVAAGPASEVSVPVDAERVDGRGRTLLPGLIDAHTHAFGDALERALEWGVTTELDMFSTAAVARALRMEQARGEASDRADLYSAGTLVTAAGGHGTQFGLPIPTLERAADAAAFVADRVAEGSDYIKIVIEDGTTVGRELATLDASRVRATIEAAHAHGKLAVVHVSTLESARLAVESGADGLVHLHHDAEHGPDDEASLVALEKERSVFVVPTLSVLEGLAGSGGGAAMADDPDLGRRLTEAQKQGLRTGFGRPREDQAFALMLARTRALEEAGVPVLAGTDAPNPGTAHGVSLHRELELLVRAGLEPSAALAAATSRTARAFGLEDRGEIAVGKKADLVLVEGDPTVDVTATRDLVAIWKDGVRRDPARERANAPEGTTPGHPTVELGAFGRFEGSLVAPYGSWMPTTDQMAGGKSVVETRIVTPGADGSAGALEMKGELAQGFAFPWSGLMFSPGAVPMSDAIDVSAADRITFWARSPDGNATLTVLLFAESFGQMPRQARLELTEAWQRLEVSLETFGTRGEDVTGVVFSAGALGPFTLELDEVAWQAEP